MGLLANQTIREGDFITTSAGAADSGKAPKLNASGQLDRSFSSLVIETTAGTTHSLTTVAGQKVIVWAKGYIDTNANDRTITLAYNGVTKDQVQVDGGLSGTSDLAWACMYTETPGAGTHNITVSGSGGSLGSVVIIVLKI